MRVDHYPIGVYRVDSSRDANIRATGRKLFSEDEMRESMNFLAANPLAAKTDLTSDEKRRVSALATALKATRKETT